MIVAKVERVDIFVGPCRFLFDEIANFHAFRPRERRHEDKGERT
jgi:hypothetical protein